MSKTWFYTLKDSKANSALIKEIKKSLTRGFQVVSLNSFMVENL